MTGIYVHIPFCIKKCNYCSFNSFGDILHLEEIYVKRVLKEIESYEGECVDTIYFGGGTPSLLKAESLIKILESIGKRFYISNESEITLEANPKTADKEKFKALKNAGFNRISFGFQSFCDDELKTLGRAHTAEDNKKAFSDAADAGFENISADIMFALPKQNMEKFDISIDEMLKLSPSHFSAYSLSVDEGTYFYEIRNTMKLPDEDAEREMYHHLKKRLADAGYEHYEISNFAKEGLRARHNTKYWTGESYIGFGAGAHSYHNSYRFSNVCDVKEYIEKENVRTDAEFISDEEKKREKYMLSLRMMDGIEKDQNPKIEKLIKLGLLKEKDGRVSLTDRGIDISNYVFSELI